MYIAFDMSKIAIFGYPSGAQTGGCQHIANANVSSLKTLCHPWLRQDYKWHQLQCMLYVMRSSAEGSFLLHDNCYYRPLCGPRRAVGWLCVCLSVCPVNYVLSNEMTFDSDIWRTGTTWSHLGYEFDGQDHRSKFKVVIGKMLAKRSVRPRVRDFLVTHAS